MRPGRPGDGLWLFGIDTSSVQITWHRLGPAAASATVGGRRVTLEATGAPGSVVVDDLDPDLDTTIVVEGGGRPRWRRRARTLEPPPGPELFRFATISDLHIGERRFGLLKTIVETPTPTEFHPVRATRAALDELTAWGAQLVVVKGDITDGSHRRDWDAFGDVLDGRDLPVLAVPGNHDTRRPGAHPVHQPVTRGAPSGRGGEIVDPRAELARLGQTGERVQIRDIEGVRMVAVDTTDPGRRPGRIDDVTDEVVQAAADAARDGTPAFVVLHHQLMTSPVPTYVPVGIPRPESTLFLDALARANPASFVTSGHTHRHRRRQHGPVVVTEVGSPKDFPGTWAGYVVHEGGIRQIVRRVARPDVLAWTDQSARAGLGLWGLWSPGRRSDRGFSHTWPGGR
jgi:3',5'-cyclic-AMP phosphodiesterase